MPAEARSPLLLNSRWIIAALIGGWSIGAGATTIDFNGLSGTCGITIASCSPFTSFTESGFTVAPLSGIGPEADIGRLNPRDPSINACSEVLLRAKRCMFRVGGWLHPPAK
jgi:hypothetical protein